MSNIKNIVESLTNEDVVTAQKLIKEELLRKLGNALEEKLVEFAPTVFNEGKKLDPVGKEDGDIDNDGDEDKTDSYLLKRRKAIAKNMKEDVEVDEEMEQISEAFKQELASLIEEIQEETGEELSEEEIAELANELLDVLSEDNEENEEDEEDEEEDESEEKGNIEEKSKRGHGTEGGTDTNY